MANRPTSEASGTGIQLESFILVKAEVELLRTLPTSDDPLPGESYIGISPERYSDEPKKLRVDFSYKSSSEYLDLSLEYRLRFVQVGAKPEDMDAFWRRMVARMVPTIAMPYVREMVHSLTSRMGSSGYLVPVSNYGTVFDPDDITIGLIGPDEAAQLPGSDTSSAKPRPKSAGGKTHSTKRK